MSYMFQCLHMPQNRYESTHTPSNKATMATTKRLGSHIPRHATVPPLPGQLEAFVGWWVFAENICASQIGNHSNPGIYRGENRTKMKPPPTLLSLCMTYATSCIYNLLSI